MRREEEDNLFVRLGFSFYVIIRELIGDIVY